MELIQLNNGATMKTKEWLGNVVSELPLETIITEMLTDYRNRYPEFNVSDKSDPVYKCLEAAAFREMSLRQRINNRARTVILEATS